ncbi:MAG: hypothetical protein GX748_18285, partial [Lentisphaerae bacterium]|nr:hypothetical protein [Lentisphaerota bacterium]
CTFEHPDDKPLLSLLWRPLLPDGWSVIAVSGQAGPEIDPSDGSIVFNGQSSDLNSPNPLVFSYVVSVPDGLTGPLEFRAEVEYLLVGMVNPLTIPVNPDPLVLREMHTYAIVSAEGSCEPPVGVYTNWHGTNLSATVATPLTVGTRTFACTGWTLAETNLAAIAGASAEVFWTLTNDVVLTWNWVAPLIEPTNAFTVAMDEDGVWQAPVISASEPYRPELVDQLSWTPLTAPANGAATVGGTGATPTIAYTPALNWYGTDSFAVQVADGLGGFDRATITVTVNPVNDPPVLAPIGDQQTDEFTPLAFAVSATDVDIPAQNLTYSISGAPANATFDSATGAFAWVPEAGQAGTEGAEFTVTVTVTDDGLAPDSQSDSETFTITLLPVRATHSTTGYVPGELLEIDCQFDYPAGRDLVSLLWRPELPEGWTLEGVEEVSAGAAPEVDPDGEAIVLMGDVSANPMIFRYLVQVPEGETGTNGIGGAIEYQLLGMVNAATVRAQPDPLVVPMLLTLPELAVADKVYDGLTNATVAIYGPLAGLMDGHDVSLVTTGAVAWFETPDVGSNAVVVSGLALTGADAAWYAIDNHVVTASIAPMPVTVTAAAQTKVYGSADPDLTYAVAPALVDGDAFTGALSRAAGKDVGTYAIGQGTLALSGNYDLTYVGANLTITPAPLTVTADGKTKAYGAALPTLTASYAGFVDGDTADGLDTPVMLATTATAASPVGAYPITASGAADVNYTISYVEGTLTVTPLSVTVTADAQTKVYGSVDPALTYAVAPALIEGDAFTGALSRAAGEDVGMYAIGQGTLALSGNYDLTYVGANLTITPAPLTVTADGKTKA